MPSIGGSTQRDQQSPGEAVGVLSGCSVGVHQTCSRVHMKLSTGSYSFGVVAKSSELGVIIVLHSEGWNLEKHGLHVYIGQLMYCYRSYPFQLLFPHSYGDQFPEDFIKLQPWITWWLLTSLLHVLKLHWCHSLRCLWQCLSISHAQPQRSGGLILVDETLENGKQELIDRCPFVPPED